MPSFQNPKPAYRLKSADDLKGKEIFRPIDRGVEGHYEFHIYAKNGVSKLDRKIMTLRCIELIQAAGGEIREDWRAHVGLVFYTLPLGVLNPVQEDDPMFRGKMVTRYWPPYTQKEREIFGLDKA